MAGHGFEYALAHRMIQGPDEQGCFSDVLYIYFQVRFCFFIQWTATNKDNFFDCPLKVEGRTYILQPFIAQGAPG